ncbi:MAG: HEAT repeat domain-containing protein [Deltaproteobacteria bacterium]|nr:HEAT repeat domain-containing protein [Deltaproteobacteria bacterium]
MRTKEDVIAKARELGFADIGFTTAEPFTRQQEILRERDEGYAWLRAVGRDMVAGCEPHQILPGARSIVVLVEHYFHQAFPRFLEPFFGRCYLDDDRMTRDNLFLRTKAFRKFLQEGGSQVQIPNHLPQRIASARAGVGDFGKNSLLFAHRVGRGGSWVVPVPLVTDTEFAPDEPTMVVGCPDWCKNVCLTACPTGALKGPRHLDPRRCISYLTYYGEGLTPRELREPMGLWVYGCDRCQNVCPRNAPWLAQELPVNPRAAAKAADFELPKLLAMDEAYFLAKIFPSMFYMPAKDLWRWQMNVARVMGNTGDRAYVPNLVSALADNPDERVRAMAAWALGRLGGSAAREALTKLRDTAGGVVREEAELALSEMG